MKWLVAGLYTLSAVVMFVSIAFIYNLNKKKVAEMTEELKARREKEPTQAVKQVEEASVEIQ